jgi:hypothetical protein
MRNHISALALSVLLGSGLLSGGVAISQDASSPNLKVMGFYELYNAARNPLAWQTLAGQNVAVTGGRFFGIVQQRFNGQTMTLLQLSGKTDFDLIDCFLANESMSTAATFKKGDPVTLGGKLAGAPDGYHPKFDGSCIAAVPNKQQDSAAGAGAAKPDVIVSVDKLEADADSNGAAFEQKYIGKIVRLTGVKVSRVGTDVVTVYHLSGPNHFPTDVVNCFPSASGKAALASLNKDQKITVTGVLKPGDFMRAPGTARIMDNCSFE